MVEISDKEYQQLLDNKTFWEESPDLCYIVNSEGKIVDCNKKVLDVLGYKKEELTGKSLFPTIYTEKSQEKAKKLFNKWKKNGILRNEELQIQAKKGEIIDVELSVDSVRDKKGNIIHSSSVQRIITKRKRAEEKSTKLLHIIGERYKELNCLYGIDRIAEREGVSLEDIFQETTKLLPPAWQFPVITCGRITFVGKEYCVGECKKAVSKISSDIMIDNEKKGIVDVCYYEERPEADEGPFLKEERKLIDSIARRLAEIVERKRIEERLHYFQMAVDNSSDAIGMSTPEGRHYYQNEAFDKLFGFNIEEVNGESGPPSTVYADEKVGRAVFETIIQGDEWQGEVQMLGKNKNIIDIFLRAYAMKNEQGKIIGLVGMHTDITARKRTEREKDKIYKFMTDRENRVIELKDEVNELLKELDRSPRYGQ